MQSRTKPAGGSPAPSQPVESTGKSARPSWMRAPWVIGVTADEQLSMLEANADAAALARYRDAVEAAEDAAAAARYREKCRKGFATDVLLFTLAFWVTVTLLTLSIVQLAR